jgi:hypothetical protein
MRFEEWFEALRSEKLAFMEQLYPDLLFTSGEDWIQGWGRLLVINARDWRGTIMARFFWALDHGEMSGNLVDFWHDTSAVPPDEHDLNVQIETTRQRRDLEESWRETREYTSNAMNAIKRAIGKFKRQNNVKTIGDTELTYIVDETLKRLKED